MTKAAQEILDEDDNFSIVNKDYDALKELYEFKRGEVISAFRYGYSAQKRLISQLKEYANKDLSELPNIIFYKKNDNKKLFNEFDRVLFCNEETSFNYVKSYLKYSNQTFITKECGEILITDEKSINFIEIKNSLSSLIKDNDNDSSQKPLSSKSDEEKSKIFKRLNSFINLYDTIKISYNKINLIYIIDSFFPKNSFEELKNFVINNFKDVNKFQKEFTIIFVQIESKMIYLYESNKTNQTNQTNQTLTLESDINELKEKVKKMNDACVDIENKLIREKEELKDIINEYRKKKMKKKMKKNILKMIKKELPLNEWIKKFQ